MTTHRDGLRVLEHLLGHLVLVLLARDNQDTLESVSLLSESEEDNLGPCCECRNDTLRPLDAHLEVACCAFALGR